MSQGESLGDFILAPVCIHIKDHSMGSSTYHHGPCIFNSISLVYAAKNIYRTLFRNELPKRNEMFNPGRMAYVVDLEDDFPESDIPTTAIRSKVSAL